MGYFKTLNKMYIWHFQNHRGNLREDSAAFVASSMEEFGFWTDYALKSMYAKECAF